VNTVTRCLIATWCVLIVIASRPREASADDPLNAFPESTAQLEERVNALTDQQRQSIQVPADADAIILSVSSLLPKPGQPISPNDRPWVEVRADGRINCGALLAWSTDRREDQLTPAELSWLLHLAVNECKLLELTTESIDALYQKNAANATPTAKLLRAQSGPIRYRLDLARGKNELEIPSAALIDRKRRREWGLDPVASLNKYLSFLAARSFLGDAESRETTLTQVNDQLQADAPGTRSFQIEHLTVAMSLLNGDPPPGVTKFDLSAVFQQEIALGDNKYKKVLGTFNRETPDAAPTIRTSVLEYGKLHP
jgi:hypothetical protein